MAPNRPPGDQPELEEAAEIPPKRLRTDPPAVITLDSGDEQDGTDAPQIAAPDEAGPSGLQQHDPVAAVDVKIEHMFEVKGEILDRRADEQYAARYQREKKLDDALAAATTRMDEMERRNDTLEQKNTELKRQNEQQAAEIAALKTEVGGLKQKLADAHEPAEVNDESNTVKAALDCQAELSANQTMELPVNTESPKEMEAGFVRSEEVNIETHRHVFCSLSFGVNDRFSSLPVPPDEQTTRGKKKPKLKDDARRALMVYALQIERPRIRPRADRIERWQQQRKLRNALRERTEQMFFCCRSFSTAFFQRSQRYGNPDDAQDMKLDLDDARCSLSLSSRPFAFQLTWEHLDQDAVAPLLLLGQPEVRRLDLRLRSHSELRSDDVREWTAILSAVKTFRKLDEVVMDVDFESRNRQPHEMMELLRDSFFSRIASFASCCPDDFRLLSPDTSEDVNKQLNSSIACGTLLTGWAKEAGIQTETLEQWVDLPLLCMGVAEREQTVDTLEDFFTQHLEGAERTTDFDAHLIERCDDRFFQPVSVWTGSSDGMKSRFVLVDDVSPF
ncbi:hypothetical protein M3Y99_00103900 [Aphelenchoides fujianensis]|nr:hypothetical protein M3Y99_00103900 [Aphelenchoides fujianensis]